MHGKHPVQPTRVLVFILVGPLFLVVLALLALLRFKVVETGGITGFISSAFALKPIKRFGIYYALTIVLPIYMGAGILAWLASMLPATLARPGLLRSWRAGEALGLAASILLWAHLVLWWQVPTALWTLPVLRAIPFVLLFPLLALASLAYPARWLFRSATAPWSRRGLTLACWLVLGTGLALAPQWLPRPRPASRGGSDPCQVLIVGDDGLRSDTFLAHADGLAGVRYANVYTPIPATRLLWHILWGGDTMVYTIGHVSPSREEFRAVHQLALLRKATQAGWKPRFYIDDGGTIGLAGRRMDLDDALMPAIGWENYVNSNLAVNFPFYAVVENWIKPFPTTNPWAALDAGLREALRLGRGSRWVMFHSCLAHQPIFLNREELGRLGRWWALAPRDYLPKVDLSQVTPRDVERMDPRTNPFRAYEVRHAAILEAWKPVWNALARDPQYQGAVRMLFSDHGERFHNVANGFQFQGVHGFNLDPWECRASLLVAGPGFGDQVMPAPRQATVSLLGMRSGVARLLNRQGPFDAAYLESCTPRAPFRYHTLATNAFGEEPHEYRSEPENDLATNTYLAPDGLWWSVYKKPAEERAKDASVGYAEGSRSTYIKPLKEGGAMESVFDGYKLLSETKIDEAAFQKAKAEVEQLFKDNDAAIR
jgi:hypothetical protein